MDRNDELSSALKTLQEQEACEHEFPNEAVEGRITCSKCGLVVAQLGGPAEALPTTREEVRTHIAAVQAERAVELALTELRPGGMKLAPLPDAVSELDRTSEETTAERDRQYEIIAEIDKQIPEIVAEHTRLEAVAMSAQKTADDLAVRRDELFLQRKDAAEKAISYSQIILDNEAARLRRGL